MVLKAAWDEEFDQPIVYYFDTVAAAAAGGWCESGAADDRPAAPRGSLVLGRR